MYDFSIGSLVAQAAVRALPLPARFRYNQGFKNDLAEPAAGVYTMTLEDGHHLPADEIGIIATVNNPTALAFAQAEYSETTGIVTVYTRTAAGSTEQDFTVLVMRKTAPNF